MALEDRALLKLQERLGSLTQVEQRVARYILSHPEEVPACSIKQLAGKCGASEASVLRLCKTMGYGGYRHFIVSITSELAGRNLEKKPTYVDIRPGDSIESIIQNVSYTNRKSIDDTLGVLDKAAVQRAVELLLKARKVEFFGIGASAMVCMDAEQKFARINHLCGMHIDTHRQFIAASLMTPEDVAVIVSNSGTTPEIVRITQLVKEADAKIIAISRYGKSFLAENADVALLFSTPEVTIRSGAMGSRIAMLNIIDILFSGVASMDYEHVEPYLNKTRHIFRDTKDK